MSRNGPASGIEARKVAQKILSEVLRKRRPLDAVQDELIAESGLEPRDAGFARAIASETLRRFGQIDALLRAFVPKAPSPHRSGPTIEIMMAGICELLFLNVAPHAAVDAANNLAAADGKAVHFKSLINAVLRRVSKEGAAAVSAQDAARLNTTDWLWQRWSLFFGDEVAHAIADMHALQPPVDFVRKDATTNMPEGASNLFGSVYRLPNSGRVDLMDGFAEGGWWVQDFAATLPVLLLGDIQDQRVIDLCAAPGGKTMQLAALGGIVTAVERDPTRLARIRDNLNRLKLNAKLIEADVCDYTPEAPAPFVLLDAPCSATGTIRRHPELPWIKSASDILLTAQASGELLDAAAAMVSSGGTLVFAVCSLEPEEGVEQVEDFLARHSTFKRKVVEAKDMFGLDDLISVDGDVRTLPHHLAEKGGMDGFYAARLVRL